MGTGQLLQYLISGMTAGCIYALVGLGFTIIFSVTGIINFAQGEFVMLGGILSFVLFSSIGLPIAVAVVLSIVITAVFGCILYTLGVRPARKASAVSLIVITIGASIFIRGIAGQIWTKDQVRPPFFSGGESLSFAGAYIQPQALWIMGTAVTTMILLHLFFTYTVVGKALRACAISHKAASLVGIDAKTMALIAFGLAAAIGAIGGAVMAPLTTTSYTAGIMLGLKGFIAAAIGGFKSLPATFLAGIIIGIVESMAVAINWGPFKSQYQDAIALAVLLIILLIRSRRLSSEERSA
jgi:branched-chain amino acid transport system permease protein